MKNKSLIIFKNSVKLRLKNTLIWGLSLVAVMALYILLFPMVKEMAMEKFESMPMEILAMFGMENFSEVTDINIYMAMIYNMVLMVLAYYSASLGAGVLHDDENSGIIEFLYSKNISRTEIYCGKTLTAVANIYIIIACTMASSLICGMIIGDGFNLVGMKFVMLLPTFSLLFFMAVGLFVASVTKRKAKATGGAVAVVIVTYVLGYVSKLLPSKLEFFKWFSPLDILSANEMVASSLISGEMSYNYAGVIFVLLGAIICAVIGGILYNKKDF